MSRRLLIQIGVVGCSVIFAGSAFSQTFDGVTPAQEGVCGGLSGAAKGICVAYCEAIDCDVNVDHPSCESLRGNYEKKTGSRVFPCDPRCGDSRVNQGSEQCDDGNAIACDGCSAECVVQNPGDPGCEQNPDPECAGQGCGFFTNCNGGGSCGFQGVCGSLAEGGGLCVDGSTQCDGLSDCTTSADCPAGGLCFVDSCRGRAVCVPTSAFCSQP